VKYRKEKKSCHFIFHCWCCGWVKGTGNGAKSHGMVQLSDRLTRCIDQLSSECHNTVSLLTLGRRRGVQKVTTLLFGM